jgi:hypothetical protein
MIKVQMRCNTFNEENEKVKTASSIENIKYSDELQSYIITDKDKGLYLLGNDEIG